MKMHLYLALALGLVLSSVHAGPWKTEIILKNGTPDILYVLPPMKIAEGADMAYGTIQKELGPGQRESLDFINRRGFFGVDENSNKVFMVQPTKNSRAFGRPIYLFVRFEGNQLSVGVSQRFEGPDEWHAVHASGFLGLGGDSKKKVAISGPRGQVRQDTLPPIKISWWINSLLHDIEFEIQ
ncbi:MAG: hypothetical protein UV79_C0003G0004 [candidate division TM6 bacterium GW2011_GWF2_43_17]|nr:MAG: hypothetical protein UV79_C0003G0004 [candidate division TM6 bacterium GW2011_GWF2_43_17]HAU30403.1 hypothetical protein [Candidatus Dependentiae bacterium]